MKRKPFIKNVIAAGFVLAMSSFMACSSDGGSRGNQPEAVQSGTEHHQDMAGGPEFKNEKIKAVYEHYTHVKNALVAANVKEAQAGAKALQAALSAAGNTKGAEIAGKLAGAQDITVQRAQLTPLTAEVEKVIKSEKLAGGTIYKQHCPMANGGKGGDWLSSEKAIANPYYGGGMKSCGSVQEEIK